MKIGLLFGQQIFANIQELKYKLTPDPIVDALGYVGEERDIDLKNI